MFILGRIPVLAIILKLCSNGRKARREQKELLNK